MARLPRPALLSALVLSIAWLPAPRALAAPGEVTGVQFADGATLAWNTVSGANDYNVYRGQLSGLRSGVPGRCHGDEIAATS